VIGGGRPWPATYGTWRDDVPMVDDTCFASISSSVIVHGHRRHEVRRPYAVFDNERLRERLAAGIPIHVSRAERIRHLGWGSRVLTTVGDVDARLVVEATGAGADRRPTAAQTAYGVVLPRPPPGIDDRAPTLMDLRPSGTGRPSFCYAAPVAEGWLVEETVLAARPPIPPAELRARLVARIGEHTAAHAELVTIPVGGRLPPRRGPVPRFGAAAGYAHPATGYSVAASLRAAPRVAAAIKRSCCSPGRPDTRQVWRAVWPRQLRRTRHLHAYGLEVLLRLDQDQLATFFDVFFELPVDVWAPYLRVDATPGDVSRAMAAVLRGLPRGMRRRLLVDPRRAWR
jgi:lycopene beta-cyclase